MKSLRIAFVVLSLTLLVGLAPSFAIQDPPPAPAAQKADKTETASGKITKLTDTSLSLEIMKNGQPKTLDFEINASTKMEGQVSTNSQAEVVYRVEAGKNIASVVRVVAAS